MTCEHGRVAATHSLHLTPLFHPLVMATLLTDGPSRITATVSVEDVRAIASIAAGTDERDSGARRAALRCIATLADVPSWAPAFDDAVLDALVAAVEVDGDAAAAGWALRALQGLSADVDADLGRYGTRVRVARRDASKAT